MDNLLDTHTFIWYINGTKDISATAKKAIEDNPKGNYVSIASIWEIAIKISIKKLNLLFSFDELIYELDKNGFQLLQINITDTKLITTLPHHHNDPFDRMIIAQAQNRHLQIISKDVNFKNYHVKIIW